MTWGLACFLHVSSFQYCPQWVGTLSGQNIGSQCMVSESILGLNIWYQNMVLKSCLHIWVVFNIWWLGAWPVSSSPPPLGCWQELQALSPPPPSSPAQKLSSWSGCFFTMFILNGYFLQAACLRTSSGAHGLPFQSQFFRWDLSPSHSFTKISPSNNLATATTYKRPWGFNVSFSIFSSS